MEKRRSLSLPDSKVEERRFSAALALDRIWALAPVCPMPRKRTLIPSPLAWTTLNLPVPHPPLPVVAERGGTQLRTPLPVAIVDTREQNPLSFRRFKGWFARVEHRALRLGDYSVEGMEDTCVVERKDLADLICSLTTNRAVFINRLRR